MSIYQQQRLTAETVGILQDFDWELQGPHYTHRHHQAWEVVLTAQGWAVFDAQGRVKRTGFLADTEVLAKYLEVLNTREVKRLN